MIIDAHAHLGYDEVFDEDFREEALLESQRVNDIDVTLVQPGTRHDLTSVQQQHDAIAALCRRYPGRFYGVANPNPHLPEEVYRAEIARCSERLGFVGIKMHPFAHAVNPLGQHGRRVFAVAREQNLPVMIQTGSGIPWAAPSLLGPVVAEYSDVRVILAHAGGGILSGEAGLLAAQYPNVSLEPSWVGGFQIRAWVRELGANRVMFGSDHGDNAATELTKFRTAGLSEEDLTWTLGGTAAQVFGLRQ